MLIPAAICRRHLCRHAAAIDTSYIRDISLYFALLLPPPFTLPTPDTPRLCCYQAAILLSDGCHYDFRWLRRHYVAANVVITLPSLTLLLIRYD